MKKNDHAPTINIYELLMNSEFIEIQIAETTESFIYYHGMIFMFTLFMLMLKDGLFCLLKKLVFISSLFFVLELKSL